MRNPQFGSLIVMVFAVAAYLILINFGISMLARLVFKSRIEEIQRLTLRAIIDGTLNPDPSVNGFISVLDSSIKRHWFRYFRTALAMHEQVRHGKAISIMDFSPLDQGDAKDPEPAFMRNLQSRLEDAVNSYLLWGGPIGCAGNLLLMRKPYRYFSPTACAPSPAADIRCANESDFKAPRPADQNVGRSLVGSSREAGPGG